MPDNFQFDQTSQPWNGGPIWLNRIADAIKARPRMILGLGILLQLAILASMIVIYSAPLVFGERIWLPVLPVDPRDYFRGDYVVLNYDFSMLPAGATPGEMVAGWPAMGDPYQPLADVPVYVTLEPDPDGKHYRAAAYSLERPAGGLYLKGRFASTLSGPLLFGIEAFYVQEGEGLVLEKLRNAGQLSAEIAVAPWGQATLCRLQ